MENYFLTFIALKYHNVNGEQTPSFFTISLFLYLDVPVNVRPRAFDISRARAFDVLASFSTSEADVG